MIGFEMIFPVQLLIIRKYFYDTEASSLLEGREGRNLQAQNSPSDNKSIQHIWILVDKIATGNKNHKPFEPYLQ